MALASTHLQRITTPFAHKRHDAPNGIELRRLVALAFVLTGSAYGA
jgi:hypothetical protein